jgi:hypothetical protein
MENVLPVGLISKYVFFRLVAESANYQYRFYTV